MEFANPPVDPPSQPSFQIGEDAPVLGPRPNVVSRPVGAKDRDDPVGGLFVEHERAVVRGAGDQGAAHPGAVENGQGALRRIDSPRRLAVVDVDVEEGKILGRAARSGEAEPGEEKQGTESPQHRGGPPPRNSRCRISVVKRSMETGYTMAVGRTMDASRMTL